MVHFLLTGRYTVYGLSSFIGHNREKETFKKYGASAGDHTYFSKKALTRDSFIHWSFSHTIIYTFNFSLLSYPTELCKVLHFYDDICVQWKKAFISFFPFPVCSHCVISLVDDWLSGWLIGWLGSCFPIRLIVWLTDWLTAFLTSFQGDQLTDFLGYSAIICFH